MDELAGDLHVRLIFGPHDPYRKSRLFGVTRTSQGCPRCGGSGCGERAEPWTGRFTPSACPSSSSRSAGVRPCIGLGCRAGRRLARASAAAPTPQERVESASRAQGPARTAGLEETRRGRWNRSDLALDEEGAAGPPALAQPRWRHGPTGPSFSYEAPSSLRPCAAAPAKQRTLRSSRYWAHRPEMRLDRVHLTTFGNGRGADRFTPCRASTARRAGTAPRGPSNTSLIPPHPKGGLPCEFTFWSPPRRWPWPRRPA